MPGFIEQLNHKFESQLGYITVMEIDHGIISTIFVPVPLIQEEQLSVIGKSIASYWRKYMH